METNKSNMVLTVLNWVIFSVLVIVLFIFSLARVDKFLKIKAIDDCAKTSRFEKTITDENTKVAYPVLDIYKNCIKDKGF